MTPENQRTAIKEELARAASSLEAARHLAEGKYFNDAVSRLYYFLYHSTKALLFNKGLEPRSHEGTLRLLGQHFVKTGILTPQDSHVLTRLMKYREEADYNPSYAFTKQDFDELHLAAVALSAKIKRHLGEENARVSFAIRILEHTWCVKSVSLFVFLTIPPNLPILNHVFSHRAVWRSSQCSPNSVECSSS
jgi:hypothetical protein